MRFLPTSTPDLRITQGSRNRCATHTAPQSTTQQRASISPSIFYASLDWTVGAKIDGHCSLRKPDWRVHAFYQGEGARILVQINFEWRTNLRVVNGKSLFVLYRRAITPIETS